MECLVWTTVPEVRGLAFAIKPERTDRWTGRQADSDQNELANKQIGNRECGTVEVENNAI